MKTLYLECNMGAAGDMLLAALLDLVPDRAAMLEKLNGLGIPGVRYALEESVKCGITGTHVRVTVDGEEEASQDETGHAHDHDHHHGHDQGHDHHHEDAQDHPHGHDHPHHHHASFSDIGALIDSLAVSDRVKADAKAVYGLIAQAESRAHGRPVEEIHFHEVGTLDAVADVVGVCLLMEEIGAENIFASPVHVGAGNVRCMHGILPVPAPATAEILKGVPTYGGRVQGELCTPTGAALLRHFAVRFGDRPVMAAEKIGYGMGTKDFEQANCLRAFLGEGAEILQRIVRLECNLDDMTGEDVAFACERLFAAGARDVFTTPIGMKKSRPGVLLSCICLPEDADRLARVMLAHTTTLGVRRQEMGRYALERHTETRETPWGGVRVKTASGLGTAKEKPEYDDVARIAAEQDLPLDAVRKAIR